MSVKEEDKDKIEGKHVLLVGLKNQKHYNQELGVVRGGITQDGRYRVKLFTFRVTLRALPRNIEVVHFEVASQILLTNLAKNGMYQLFDYNKFQQCEYASMMRGNIFDGAEDPTKVACTLPEIPFLISKSQREKLRGQRLVGDCFAVSKLLTYVVRASSLNPSATLDLVYSGTVGLDTVEFHCKDFLVSSTEGLSALFFEFSYKGLSWPQVDEFYSKAGLSHEPFHSGVILRSGSKFRVVHSFSGLFDLKTCLDKNHWTDDGERLIDSVLSLAVPKTTCDLTKLTEDLFGFPTSEHTNEFFEQKKELGVKVAHDLDESKFLDSLGNILSIMLKVTA